MKENEMIVVKQLNEMRYTSKLLVMSIIASTTTLVILVLSPLFAKDSPELCLIIAICLTLIPLYLSIEAYRTIIKIDKTVKETIEYLNNKNYGLNNLLKIRDEVFRKELTERTKAEDKPLVKSRYKERKKLQRKRRR